MFVDSAEACVARVAERVRKLEDAGVIRGYRALVDARKLGLTLLALIHISMDRHTPERFANFDAAVNALPEVLECLLITGQDAERVPWLVPIRHARMAESPFAFYRGAAKVMAADLALELAIRALRFSSADMSSVISM